MAFTSNYKTVEGPSLGTTSGLKSMLDQSELI